MKNKSEIAILAAAILLIVSMGIVQADSPQAPAISVSIAKYDPTPAESGNTLELWLSVKNIGNAYAYNYNVELDPQYPFLLDAGETAVKNFPIIDFNGVNVRYKLRIASDAPDGDTPLVIKTYVQNSGNYNSQTLSISVLGKADYKIASVDPNTLLPGNPTAVNFTIMNTGKAPLKDMVVEWNDPTGKILPLSGDNHVKINNLDVGQSTAVQFSMIADPSIVQGVHMINLNSTFLRFGTADSRISQIAFIVGGLTSFDVAQQDIEDSTISLSVANIGVNTGTAVSVSVPEQDNWQILGGSSVFLGNLNPGDFTVGSLQIKPTKDTISQSLKVDVDYTDTTGIRRTVEKNIMVNFVQAQLSKKSSETSPVVYVVVVVVVLAILWFVNRKFKILRRIMPK